MNSGRLMNLRVTIPAESRRMNVGKDVIRILGSPAYICVLQDVYKRQNYNELYRKRIEEYDHKITELEAERQNLQTAPNAYPFLDVYRKYRKLEEITRPMVVELIEKIEVYEGCLLYTSRCV